MLPSSAINPSADATTPIQRRRFPCSPEQRRFWILERLEPGNTALMIAVRWRLEGAVSGIEIEHALAVIIERHQTLRSFIVEENGELVQQVEPDLNFRLARIDLSRLIETDALAEVERISSLEARIAFDLSQAPLIRATQLYVRENLSILLVTAHRLVCDAGSFRIMARELLTNCALLRAGGKNDPAELPIRYVEPAARQHFTEKSLRRNQDFWIRSLHGLKYFELYPDHARPQLQTSNGNIESVMFDQELMKALAQLSSGIGGGIFVITLAALFTLLQRYSGETDIVIGNQLEGREDAAVRGLVGVFVNTVLRRADLSGDPTFDELLARLHDVIAQSSAYLGIGLDHLIELLKPRRDLSRNPLFSVNFVFRNGIVNHEIQDGFRLVDLPVDSTGVLCDLNFIVVQQAEGLQLSCEYCTDLFERQTVRQMLHHFGNLLRAAAASPAQKISTMPMLDDAERQRLVVDNNCSGADYPQQLSLPQLFEAQVERTPDVIALICGEQSQSYRQLDRAANRLAHALQSRGIGSGSRVGICLDRSPDLLVALLAVLKAGASYVPLDPAYPSLRLTQIIEDAQPAAVLSKLALRERLPVRLVAISSRDASRGNASPAASEPVLILLDTDTDAAMISEQPDVPPASTIAPDHLAYVIFTSGSTGRPKGVQIQHRALTNLLWAMRKQPGLESTDTLLSVTTVSFDIAALELFLPLIVGAKLVIAQDGETADGSALLDLLRWHGVTVMQATPVTWQILLAAGWRGEPRLKMLCGGEALTRQLADQLLPYSGARGEPQSLSPQSDIARGGLWNMYGPTETTIWSSSLRVESGYGPVPIGPPIANTQFYVLDPHGQLAPAGAPGELYIGGDGVALGYLHLPEMTRERFVPDPFCGKPQARMYRTGDRVRLRPDASLEFLGRADHQIKLRGFRIELGEIEAVLRADPELADCVLVSRANASGEMAIEAYVVMLDGPPERAANLNQRLQASLRQKLPAYMCPSFIGVLEALPRTPNGKVDRGALPPSLPQHQAGTQSPLGNAIERRLAKVWSAVLGISEIAADTNFFEIGGHSLLAVRLLAGIDVAFGRRLSLSALFKNPTIAAQAKLLIDGDALAFDFRQVLKLQPNGARPPLIAINNTGIYYSLSRRLGQDQPFTSLQLFDPALPQASMPKTLEQIAAGYAQLIRRVQPNGPYSLLGWCVAGTLAFEVARQLLASGQCVSRLILFDTWVPGYLRRLPWHQARLADYSFRWKLVAADWVKAKLGPRPLTTFLANREFVKKIIGWCTPQPSISGSSEFPQNSTFSPEQYDRQYDRWLLQYLEQAAESYDVKLYPGTVTLFRSSQEPAGRFLDPQMGWGAFAGGGVEVLVIDGDHFSIFQEPIVAQLARRVALVLDASPAASEAARRWPLPAG